MDNLVLTKWPMQGIISSLWRVFGGFPQIVAGYLFGSYARGEENPLSDLDIVDVVILTSDLSI